MSVMFAVWGLEVLLLLKSSEAPPIVYHRNISSGDAKAKVLINVDLSGQFFPVFPILHYSKNVNSFAIRTILHLGSVTSYILEISTISFIICQVAHNLNIHTTHSKEV